MVQAPVAAVATLPQRRHRCIVAVIDKFARYRYRCALEARQQISKEFQQFVCLICLSVLLQNQNQLNFVVYHN